MNVVFESGQRYPFNIALGPEDSYRCLTCGRDILISEVNAHAKVHQHRDGIRR